MTDKKATFTTMYQSPDAGTVTFDRGAIDEEIVACLQIVRQIRGDYKDHGQLSEGLSGVESRLLELRASKAPEDELRRELNALMRVPLGEDKSLHLEAFRRSTGQARPASSEEYLAQVGKMVRNTLNNAALLLVHRPGDSVLTRLVEDLQGLDLNDFGAVRTHMSALGKSPQLWHYNEKKKAFLVEWLTPFQDQLGKPIAQMTEEEFQAALRQVETLRDRKLEEMTHLMVDSDRAPFRPYNRTMNPLVNGRDDTFWGGPETRNEFVQLLDKLITRFSFTLEDRYLVFRTKDGGFCYLVGFSDDAFAEARVTGDGKLALYPHLKVFVKNHDGDYAELTLEFYNRNGKVYYSALKTSVVPFLRAAAVMVETELSDDLKAAFDMWT